VPERLPSEEQAKKELEQARKQPLTSPALGAAATLLFVDAWLDVRKASSRSELLIAIVEAAVVELQIAVFCLLARSGRGLAAAELGAEACA
jgi:hypothetical protein